MNNFQTIAVRKHESVATVILNRPEKRNALNSQMCRELKDIMLALDRDNDTSVILMKGNGPSFCAGADLSERKSMSADDVRLRRLIAFSAYEAIENIAKPCICVMDGAAIGAGAEIATACDFIVGTENAYFQYPEVGWGTIGATQRLPEIVGRRCAKNLLFTGRKVLAEEAMARGLLAEFVRAENLDAFLDELTLKIAATSVDAIKRTKKCIDERAKADRRAALGFEILEIETLLSDKSWKGSFEQF